MDKSCRLCLKTFGSNDIQYEITEEIKEEFKQMTQMELILSIIEKNLCCETCLKSIQAANFMKKQFIANQKKFITVDQVYNAESIDIDDIIMEQYIYMPEPSSSTVITNSSGETTDEMMSVGSSRSTDDDLNSFMPQIAPNTSSSWLTKLESFKKYPSKSSDNLLKLASKTSFKKSSEPIKCKFCLFSFKDIRTHLLNCHPNESFKCEKCTKVFDDLLVRNLHMENCKPKEKSHGCPLCKGFYTTPHGVNKHIDKCHPNRKFRCTYESCKDLFTFTERNDIRRHIMSEHFVSASNANSYIQIFA